MQAEYKVVTRKSILLAYQMLRGMEPFCGWKLPATIQTKVVNDISMYGCFEDPTHNHNQHGSRLGRQPASRHGCPRDDSSAAIPAKTIR
jgi:hypothetical protein